MQSSRTGRGRDLWPVLLLVIVVVVPTIGVLGFVGIALKNERLATRQRLADAYRAQLSEVAARIDRRWTEITQEVDSVTESLRDDDAQAAFFAAAQTGTADSVVAVDLEGQIEYPRLPPPVANEFASAVWQEASRLEYEAGALEEALSLYQQLSGDSGTDLSRATAVQAQARCLLKLGRPRDALGLVWDRFATSSDLADARDPGGRLLAANVELMIVEAIEGEETAELSDRLLARLDAHSDQRLPATQRVFLQNRLAEKFPGRIDPAMLLAESLASQYAAAHPTPVRTETLRSSQLPDVWQIATPSRRYVMLFRTETVAALSRAAGGGVTLPDGVALSVAAPGVPTEQAEWVSIQAGSRLPGWRLALLPSDGWIDSDATHHQTLYLWITVLVILFTAVAGGLAIAMFRRQIRVANLKNDLVGTVSHELKTPLSSMRLLVDTLLDAEEIEPKKTRKYLQLISKENSRLSRLIENFLTFSRLEEGRHDFESESLSVAALVEKAVESAGDRFQVGCKLNVKIDEELPAIRGDSDALVMALLNFLDNAYKYSTDPRVIELSAHRDGDSVCIAVGDNGIGMSRAETRRIFQKFYQVDQSLVREGQGCGLGLSIVNYIVRAHQGDVSVTSRPGEGSTFEMRIPVESNDGIEK